MNKLTLALLSLASLSLTLSSCKGPCDTSIDPECVYRFVMVRDRTNPARQSETQTVGADIFGIALYHDTLDVQINASSITDCGFGTGDNGWAKNCDYAKGVGDSICSTDDESAVDYVSLGGMGGWVIAAFNNEVIDKTDYVRVYECPRRMVGDRKYDHYDIYVGVNDDPEDPSWVLCRDWATTRTDCHAQFDEEAYIDLSWYDPDNVAAEEE